MNFPLPFPSHTLALFTRSPSFFSSHPSHASSLRINFVFCATTAITFSSSFLRSTTLPSPPHSQIDLPRFPSLIFPSLTSHSLRRSTSSALVAIVCWRSPLRDCMLIGDFGCHLEHCFLLRASDFPVFLHSSSSLPTDRSARRSVQISR